MKRLAVLCVYEYDDLQFVVDNGTLTRCFEVQIRQFSVSSFPQLTASLLNITQYTSVIVKKVLRLQYVTKGYFVINAGRVLRRFCIVGAGRSGCCAAV